MKIDRWVGSELQHFWMLNHYLEPLSLHLLILLLKCLIIFYLLSMVTQHPFGIFMFACLRLCITSHTMQHEAMTTFLDVHSVCESRGVVMVCIYTVIGISWMNFFLFSLAFFLYIYFILSVMSIKMLTF